MADYHCFWAKAPDMRGFSVQAIEPVVLEGPERLLACQLLSPFAWRAKSGARLSLLFRATVHRYGDEVGHS